MEGLTASQSQSQFQSGKPRRPHHKSRTGCVQCKQRKVKCDEQKPICKKCEGHGVSCSYLQTYPLKRGPPTIQSMLASPQPTNTIESSPTPSIPKEFSPPLPPNFTMLDLELLHFWSTQSVQQLADFENCIEMFRTAAVQMAFEYPFLMHEILSLSALHLAHLRPAKSSIYHQTSDTHAATALTLFQPHIVNLTSENCHACYAFSTILFVHAWAAQDLKKPSALLFRPKETQVEDTVNIQWVKLHRGSYIMLKDIFPIIANGPMEPLFAPWKSLDPNRPDPLLDVEKRQLDDLADAWKTSPSVTAEQIEILDVALSKLVRVFSMMTYNLSISRLSSVMGWLSMISDEYLKLLEQKMPEATLLVVYYCVALKRLEHLWWMRGKAENLLNTLNGELGPGWERWTRWPTEQVLGNGAAMGYVQMISLV